MFRYLWLKNVKTDLDFKRYQLLKLLLFIILGIGVLTYVFLNTSSPYGEVSRFFRVFWFTIPFLIGIISSALEVYQQVKSPEKLHAKRIEATDERKKQSHQQALSHIGMVSLILCCGTVLFSINEETVTMPVAYIVGLLALFVLYLAYRIRK